jgi:hypothetical protein
MSVLCIKDASSVTTQFVDAPTTVSDITFFYLVWPALLQEIQGYCYINK